MKIQYKKQQFQTDAVNAICDVFRGQGKESYKYILRKDIREGGQFSTDKNIYAWKNSDLILSNDQILSNIQEIQRNNELKQSEILEGKGINLTIEMETGTGKTYTYINTIFELNKRYDWTKFIIVTPSVAIREGIEKAFLDTEEHFATLYGKKIRHFIFDSTKPSPVESFATNSGISVMIINSQAFGNKDTRNIYKMGERGTKLIEYISSTKPILIIDEPQSVEGPVTKKALWDFSPLFIMRYSATHKEKYNMVYKLDAVDAFNKELVKKISVKGVQVKGTDATHAYLYLEGIDLYKDKEPTARIEFEVNQNNGIVRKGRKLKRGDDLFIYSNKITQYKGYIVSEINGRDDFVSFTNGRKLEIGHTQGDVNEDYKRRIQIRYAIRAHLRKESQNFKNGIKTLSLFFIDEVKNYRSYSESGEAISGKYVKMFEEEYSSILEEYINENQSESYIQYLTNIDINKTHEGYFSVDKKGKLINPKEKGRGTYKKSEDVGAFEKIMKRKDLLLDLNEPIRFIFSHSALREGWDNPNVFQICILRNTDPREIKTRQEVGRGLRLCINQEGYRIDRDFEGLESSQINVLTVIANESYQDYAKTLQNEFNENLKERPSSLTKDFLIHKRIDGERITEELANKIIYKFIQNGYIDENNKLTEKFFEEKDDNSINLGETLQESSQQILDIVKDLYSNQITIINEDGTQKIRNKVNYTNFNKKSFKNLWEIINKKTTYHVSFDSKAVIEKSITQIDQNLKVSKISIIVKGGVMGHDTLFEDHLTVQQNQIDLVEINNEISSDIKYDLIGEVVDETGLKRETIIEILSKISSHKFELYRNNPEEFITKVSEIINDQKALIINESVEYTATGDLIPISIFEDHIQNIGKSKEMNKYIYDYLVADSEVEFQVGSSLDNLTDIEVFAKLPRNTYNIYTPLGLFSPDWIIVVNKDLRKHTYFVFETKGSTRGINLREIEKIKIACARKHFKAISNDQVVFEAVENFDQLRNELI